MCLTLFLPSIFTGLKNNQIWDTDNATWPIGSEILILTCRHLDNKSPAHFKRCTRTQRKVIRIGHTHYFIREWTILYSRKNMSYQNIYCRHIVNRTVMHGYGNNISSNYGQCTIAQPIKIQSYKLDIGKSVKAKEHITQFTNIKLHK